ncbi:hypothetical protein N9937_02380 [bacterium]|nr:hypothetical protein [bacterium]
MSGKAEFLNDAYVVFKDVEFNYKFKRYIKPGFRHVYLLLNNGIEWMVVDSYYGRCYIYCLPVKKEDWPEKYLEGMHKGIKIKIGRLVRRRISFQILNHLSCVSLVKMYLGLRIWVHTPYGLYKYLMKMKETGNYKQTIKTVSEFNQKGELDGSSE